MSDRPNIILIITDQQRYDTINALGFSHMETPNLDRLVKEGVSLSHCFITAPSCAPSRASLFTGLYPHTTGILKNADRWTRCWVEDLAESGYRCINIGKMHTYPYDTPAGFHERYVVENKDRFLEERWFYDEWDKGLRARGLVKQQRELYRKRDDYGESLGAFDWELPEDAHSDVFTADMAIHWLKEKPKPDGPLFMEIGLPGPHPPYDPPKRYAEKYLDKDLPIEPVRPDDIADQPTALKTLREHNFAVDHDSVVHLPDPTPEQRHRQRAYYLGNVTLIDEKVGEIMETLEKQGYLEDAVVIFTSDHGDCLTDHGHSQKWTMYDTITRVPCIAWSPSRFPAGKTVDGLWQWMDLGPTILELAGVDRPEWMEAQSLMPVLTDPALETGRDTVFAEHGRDGILDGTDFMTMVRDRDWKLVHFIDHPDGQLFDLVNDPGEVNNLWDDPAHAGRKQQLLDTMREWLVHSQVRTRHWQSDFR